MDTIAEGGLRQPFIGGEWHESPGAGRLEAVNPATGQVLAELTLSGSDEVDAAVAAARDAQKVWARMPAARRVELILAWGDVIARHAEEIALLDVQEMGKVITDARGEQAFYSRLTRYWAGMADKVLGDQIPMNPGHLSYTVREPLGVVGVLIPWNGPAIMCISRVSTALAAGNAVVLKPSELGTLSTLRLAELTVEAGLPPGLVNVIPGDGTTGSALVTHPGVNGVNFTGSVPTGRAIAAAAAPLMKKLVLELGGKAPSIVFDDADLDAAARGSVWGIFQGTGQVCVASTRLLVQRSVADQMVERLAALAGRVRVGDPMDPSAQIGPVVSGPQLERVLGYIDVATEDGASIVSGGGRLADAPHPGGYYVQPTIVTDVDPEARVAKEEVFGPVLSVLTFDDEADAIRLANDTEFGLSANIWTSDLGRMLSAAEQVESGVVWGNTPRLMDPGLGFGGFKQSGQGYATGREALEGVTRIKRVSIRFDPDAPMPAWPEV